MNPSKLSKFYARRPDVYKHQLENYNQGIVPYSLLSTEPPIFCLPYLLSEVGFASLKPIFDYLQDQTAYFLYNWWLNIEHSQDIEIIKVREKDHISFYPKHKFIHLCNTLQQVKVFQGHGLNAIFCNQNCLVDERIFYPISPASKLFDAVYDAKITAFKRHYLARKVNKIAFIYYYDAMNDFDCLKEVISQFPDAHFFNHNVTNDPSKTYNVLSPFEVNKCLNRCKVGLCLSSIEGAMYASIQYLLSGLPIVSTNSKGGRDIFFDSDYVLITEDDPDAVKEGVDEMIRRNIPANLIRSKVLEKIKKHRLTLIELIQSIYDLEGVKKDFSVEWDQLFFNKLHRHQSPYEAMKCLENSRTIF